MQGELPYVHNILRYCFYKFTISVSVENLLGKGGHAEVYKGCLADGQVVAVKRLMRNEKEIEGKAGDFLTELGIIAHINHPNATRLIGFGIDNGLYFVLQLAPHGSLSSLLFGTLLNLSHFTIQLFCIFCNTLSNTLFQTHSL